MRRPRATAILAVVTTVLFSDTLAVQVHDWNSDIQSAVTVKHDRSDPTLDGAETHQHHRALKPIPLEYFQYPAQKPQFAIDVATYHGVPNPQSHYKAYPIRPYTGLEKPVLGRHKIFDHNKEVFRPFQRYTQENERLKISPVVSDYEIFHPYKAEEPHLQSLYRDPVLGKIKNDIRLSQNRLQQHETEAGKADINDDDNLEKFEETDRKKVPEKNIPAPYETHVAQRRPIYYQPPATPLIYNNRENILNHRFKHPLNQHYAKIKPMHYQPIKKYIAKLKQHQGIKFDDTRNQYPQLPPAHKYTQPEPEDGYEIYEQGKANYARLRNNVDESINKAVQENHPPTYQKLELQRNNDKSVKESNNEEEDDTDSNDEEEEFVPVKNYAQVRKTETMKHVPRSSAYEDAESYDEIINAPRLKEAIKSTKAQTVYTEEGYEDAAYDHAGEQKHAEEKEGHGGYLKEKEISGGKYKIPSVSAKYEDGHGNEYGDQILHDDKWKNDDKDSEEETKAEDYSEDEGSIESDIYEDIVESAERNKREGNVNNGTLPDITSKEINPVAETSLANDTIIKSNQSLENILKPDLEHGVNKRETKFKVPEINLTSTFLTEEEMAKLGKVKEQTKQVDVKEKYPYYFENIKRLNRDSPLRYAENLKFIPRKSNGGTEFYNSKSIFECPEVDEDVDAIPEINENNKDNSTDPIKKAHRLKGLGDKIDCFKAKFFGENPLDSPFFKEDLILNPEPVTLPNKLAYKLINRDEPSVSESKLNDIFNNSKYLQDNSKFNISELFSKLKNGQKDLQTSLINTNNQLRTSLSNISPVNISAASQLQWPQQADIYTDVLGNIKNSQQSQLLKNDNLNRQSPALFPTASTTTNVTYDHFQNKEDVTKSPTKLRKKRAAPFLYEPYKIIRGAQSQDTKKINTLSNVSPLIKQLQSSKVIDSVANTNQTKEQPVKRNITPRTYKDIGRRDRAKSKGDDNSDDRFVDVSVDPRRGEPRYELKPSNHKPQYSPVENKTTMSVDDYMAHKNKSETHVNDKNNTMENKIIMNIQRTSRQRLRQTTSSTSTTEQPYYDINKYLPKIEEIQKLSASNTVRRIIRTTTPAVASKRQTNEENSDLEGHSDKEELEKVSTSTEKQNYKRRTRTTTSTTAKTKDDDENVTRYPKLRLITRFHSTTEPSKLNQKKEVNNEEIVPKSIENDEAPKYSEKQKKSSSSTIVTDTQSYGGDDKDTEKIKEELDSMIGVKQDTKEYMPEYEKEEQENRSVDSSEDVDSGESEEEDNDDDENDNEEEEDEDDEEEEELAEDSEPKQSTSEPVRRTLVQTTEAPSSTTATHKIKQDSKPVLVSKKKIEVHKELPANKTSPRATEFKQDIKEIEIVKQLPQVKRIKKPRKNIEALELYKDDDLAKEVNKLGEVEVFKENLDLRTGPKHGGNYRSARIIELQDDTAAQPLHGGNLKALKDDAATSQSEVKKLIKAESENVPSNKFTHRTNTDVENIRPKIRIRGRNRKSDTTKSVETTSEATGGQSRSKNAKLIEFSGEQGRDDDDGYTPMHGGNFKSDSNSKSDTGRRKNNYRSAKIVQKDDLNSKAYDSQRKPKGSARDVMDKAAIVLNSFAQLVPMLTTTPAYILDPSKRKYYYVDS